jgi:arginine utilization protein RocB
LIKIGKLIWAHPRQFPFFLENYSQLARYYDQERQRQEKPMVQRPALFIYRHHNKHFVRRFMNNLDWQPNDNNADLANQDKYSLEQLKAMQLVAKMKEAADRAGAGFVGGFVTPTGQRFMMSNVDENDAQFQAIHQELESMQNNKKVQENNPERFFDRLGSVKIVEGPDGIQLKIEPDAE